MDLAQTEVHPLLLPLPLDRDTAFSGAGLAWALLWVALPGLLGEHLATLPTKLSWVRLPSACLCGTGRTGVSGGPGAQRQWVSGIGVDASR